MTALSAVMQLMSLHNRQNTQAFPSVGLFIDEEKTTLFDKDIKVQRMQWRCFLEYFGQASFHFYSRPSANAERDQLLPSEPELGRSHDVLSQHHLQLHLHEK